ncbi:MAG: rhomboid family intramembrane serine protease, partial [Candidatus Micrarchaeota archaeon]
MKMSLLLLGIIAISFILQIAIGPFTQIFYFNPANLQIWQFITSIFLHGSVIHLLFNAYALFLFG